MPTLALFDKHEYTRSAFIHLVQQIPELDLQFVAHTREQLVAFVSHAPPDAVVLISHGHMLVELVNNEGLEELLVIPELVEISPEGGIILGAIQVPDAFINDVAANTCYVNLDTKDFDFLISVIRDLVEKNKFYRDETLIPHERAFRTRSPLPKNMRLTRAEQDIVRHLVCGKSNQEIADIRTVAISTIESQINGIFHKIGRGKRNSRMQVARQAAVDGLTQYEFTPRPLGKAVSE